MPLTLLEIERRRRGWSATELARRMGVGKSTVSAVERLRRSPSAAFKRRAAEELGLAERDLWPEPFAACSGDDLADAARAVRKRLGERGTP